MTIQQALLQISNATIYSLTELTEAAYNEAVTPEEKALKVWLNVELQGIFQA